MTKRACRTHGFAAKAAQAVTKDNWREAFKNSLTAKAKASGCELGELAFETCTTDNTWGDRVGLVFFGAPAEVQERAARYFEKWADANMNWGGYESQRSVRYEGEFHFARFDNGANGWYRGALDDETAAKKTLVESRVGHATSYVYYPCAD